MNRRTVPETLIKHISTPVICPAPVCVPVRCVLGLIRVCVQKEKNIDLVVSFPLLSLDLGGVVDTSKFVLSSVIETAEFDLAEK